MATKYLMTDQTIADDQTQVATKLQELMDDNFVSTLDDFSYDIETFGANKFLITIVFYGNAFQAFISTLGLTSAVSRLIKLKRTLSTKVGLIATSKLNLVVTKSVTNTIGLIGSVIKKLSFKPVFSVGIGIGPAIEFELISPTTFILNFGLKTVSPILALIYQRGLNSTIGLIADMVYTYVDRVHDFSDTVGLKLTWKANLNGVNIEPLV